MDACVALPKRYVDVDEVAAYLHVPPKRIYRMVESRSIPFILFGGKKTLRFDLRAIDKWMERQVIPAKPEGASLG